MAQLHVVINGESVDLTLPGICRLRGVVRMATKITRNTGVPWTRWEIYDRLGRRLDEDTMAGSLPLDPVGIRPETTLYLALKIGAGGCVDFTFAEAA